ncbi:MAG: NAD(P)-dependent alcohol dehydrogenase [Pseudomonadota bacterium]
MRKMTVTGQAGLEDLKLSDVDVGEPGAGEVQVQWKATSLNYHDLMVAQGLIPVAGDRVPMSDGAGEVVAVGQGVTRWQVGDRVMSTFFPLWRTGAPALDNMWQVAGETVDGFALDRSNVGEHTLTTVPDGYTDAQAATLPCAAVTAWRALVEECNVRPGDTVLIEGTGGMSLFALQIAKAAGATVIATSSSDEKLERLRDMGADHTINYRSDENWGKTAYAVCGGVDHVLDVGGGATIRQSTEAVAIGGNIVLIGILGGRKGEIVFPKYFFKQVHLAGIAVGSHVQQKRMVRAINQDGFKPVIDKSFSLPELGDAFAYQASGQQFGKIVVEY